jgi:hypothetical protein
VSDPTVEAFLHRLNKIPKEYPPELVFNMDETAEGK